MLVKGKYTFWEEHKVEQFCTDRNSFYSVNICIQQYETVYSIIPLAIAPHPQHSLSLWKFIFIWCDGIFVVIGMVSWYLFLIAMSLTIQIGSFPKCLLKVEMSRSKCISLGSKLWFIILGKLSLRIYSISLFCNPNPDDRTSILKMPNTLMRLSTDSWNSTLHFLEFFKREIQSVRWGISYSQTLYSRVWVPRVFLLPVTNMIKVFCSERNRQYHNMLLL